ncbi:MAG: serine/threonine-protein phosphatase [Chloroflexi bacterium]|uniref:Protein phosphatase 2C domain-containing protein n=1 Tax=Candidatus Chlorohelix allophototropha TaxID=3003348 RepID=A0A8T7M484_9CHLR|nr:serine/threonine-protein phosphatase [Chloroflexota bacterium]WJW70115.1 protein phosphatase 2C domain-containing protein [Chloroflexota bacterium L227-S17]
MSNDQTKENNRLLLEYAGCTDKGQLREENQDYFKAGEGRWLWEPGYLFVVADGVGGNRGGAVASHLAVESFFERFSELMAEIKPAACLQLSFEAAHQALRVRGEAELEVRGMATTLVAAYCAHNRVYIGSVGDSRLLLLRKGGLNRLTKDHSLVNERLEQGLISISEAPFSPYSHVITRAVGKAETIKPDFFEEDLEEGDWLVLCTDGVYRELSDEEIVQLVTSSPDAQSASGMLVDAANKAGGHDNITALVVRVVKLGKVEPLTSNSDTEQITGLPKKDN